MASKLALLAVLAGHVVAQSSVLTMFVFNASKSDTILASVIGADPTGTTYLLGCPNDRADCVSTTLTQGPSSQSMVFTRGSTAAGPTTLPLETTTITTTVTSELTYMARCTMSSNEASCDATRSVSSLTSIEHLGSNQVVTSLDQSLVPVTVTAGLEKLPTSATTPTTSAHTGGLPRETPNAILAGLVVALGAAVAL